MWVALAAITLTAAIGFNVLALAISTDFLPSLCGSASSTIAGAHSLRHRLRQSFSRRRPPLLRPFEQPLAILGIIRLSSGQSALLGALFV
jgi:hypothetical protein